MLSLLRHLARLLPTPEWILNHVVARLPYAAWRMRLYQAFGVRFADVRTGCVMLGAQLHYPRRIAIGRNSIVGPGCDLDARGGITIGDDVNISGGTRFMTAKHDVQDPDFVARFAPVVVEDRVWIALGATVLGGVRIGEGAVVAANATVTADVAPFTIVGGTPAVAIGERTRDLRYHLDYRPNWT